MKVAQSQMLQHTADNMQHQIDQITRALSHNISFGSTTKNTDGEQNIDGWKATGTTPGVANTEFAVNHGLNHVPFGFIVLSTDKAAHIYKSTTAWTKTQIFLKCDVATVAFVIFIL